MSVSNNPTIMHRSTSMPVNPHYLEPKQLKRSQEKETVYEDDYYPESPIFERSDKFEINSGNNNNSGEDEGIVHAYSAVKKIKNCTSSHEWAGSTVELNADMLKNDQTQLSNGNKRKYRVIEKNGRENVIFRKIPEKSWRFFRDFVTTLIELDWKYMLSMFVGSYFASWFFFAVLVYTVAYSHGDLFFDEVTGERLGEGKDPCIIGVYNFVSILIYSIETQTTIGFGEKYPSEECPESIFLFIMQIIVSIGIEGGMISIIYAKTARPAKQMTKLKFSEKAVICYRDDKLCLLFRVCDPREQQTIESKIRVFLLVDHPTREGEIIKRHSELKLEGNGRQLIVWPEIVCHVIDEHSPLHCYTNAKEFNAAKFELYVTIVGVSPATAQVTEARTSYLPREIFWGQRFVNIINYDAINERYVIDNKNFNTTISVDMQPNGALTEKTSKSL